MLWFELDMPINDLEEILFEASHLPQTIMGAVADGLRQYVEDNVLFYLAEYPPERAEGDIVDWVSEKQRKTVMAKLREMGMEDGYDRTQTLWDSWEVRAELDGRVLGPPRDPSGRFMKKGSISAAPQVEYELTLSLINDATDPFGTEYARFVHDEEWQQPFHRDQGWQTDQTVGQAIAQRAMDHLDTLVDDALS